MPICNECGTTLTRLQWTHFKYKCTGRFASGTEYLKIYPGAELVDSALKKKAAFTKASSIKKYGEEAGTTKWENYVARQAYTNSYEYKKEKHNWSRKEFSEYNKSRSVTLENLINSYGEDDGTIRWMNYCERQAHTNTIEYFQEKYGTEVGSEKYNKLCFLKSHSIDAISTRLGISETDAVAHRTNYKQSEQYSSGLERNVVSGIEALAGKLDYTVYTKQYCIYANGRVNFYDIVHNRKAIEINGDYWHCNPTIYEPTYYHQIIGHTAREIWKQHQNKVFALSEHRGIPTLVIWEKDYINNPPETIDKCINWLTNTTDNE